MDAIDQAGYELVHTFPGGAPALAPHVNMNAGTLLNKANPSCTDHKFTVREVVAIQSFRKSYPMLYAEARVLNHICVKLGQYPDVSDVELLDLYAKYHEEIGETAGALRRALQKGQITQRDYDDIKREAFEDAQAMFELLARLKGLVRE